MEGDPPKLKTSTMQKRTEAHFGPSKKPEIARMGRSRFKFLLKECLELLECLGIPWIQAAGEAEATCAYLNANGYVDGCITNDGDIFLYGAQAVYQNFTMNIKDPHVDCYLISAIEEKLGCSRESLIGLAILLGCDYLPKGVPGVGKEQALKLIKTLKGQSLLQRFESWKDHFQSGDIPVSTAKKVVHCSVCRHPGRRKMTIFNKLNVGIAVSSFAIFQLSFHVLSSWISSRLTAGFNNLDQKKKIEWNSRTVSTFHALVVGIFCVYILLYDEASNVDRVWGDPSTVQLNLAITSGYLISDLLLIILYWKAIGDIFFVIHHVVALYAYYFVLDRGLLPYFANFRLLAEFSTPFVNQRWFFEVLGYSKASKSNIINGLLMTIMFFLGRIIVIPIYYNSVASEFGTEAFYRLGFAAQSAWFISSIVLDIMNLMWMVKITKGCYKVICLIGQEESKAHKNGNSDNTRKNI